MALPDNAVFNQVVLYFQGGRDLSFIFILNDDAGVGTIYRDQTYGVYDTTTDEFQQVADRIADGSAVVFYRFGNTVYGNSDLPAWLDFAREANPFYNSSRQVSLDPVTRNRIRFKNFPAPGTEDVVYPIPNVEYDSETNLNIGLLADGWYKEEALPAALGDPDETVVIEMETTETTTPIVNSAGNITGYGFQVTVNSINSDAVRYSDDDGATWTEAKPPNPTHYATLLANGDWVEHLINPAESTPAATGALHVSKGTVYSSYQSHVTRGWDVADIPIDDIHRFEIRATAFSGWGGTKILSANISFSPQNIPLITPHDYETGQSSEIEYETWFARMNKIDGHLIQGLHRTPNFISDDWSSVRFAMVSYPEFAVGDDDANIAGRQYIPISSADGLASGDTLFFTAADGAKEQCKFLSIATTWVQGNGVRYDVVEVERAINGTTLMTIAQEDSATGTGIIDRKGVLHRIVFRSASTNEYPMGYNLVVAKK